MRRSKQQHARWIAIIDRAQQTALIVDGQSERHALTLFTAIERALRNEFYSNHRRATDLA
jgi:hypothetical protein